MEYMCPMKTLLTAIPVTASVVVEGDAADIVFTAEGGAFNCGCGGRISVVVIMIIQAVF